MPCPRDVMRLSSFSAVASQTTIVKVSRMTMNAFATCRNMYRPKSVMGAA
jgi:hypothetical protein